MAETQMNWKTSHDGLERYRERLHKADEGGRAILMPFKALHAFKGFAHVLTPGTLVGIVGTSGGLKTSFLTTITDQWRQTDDFDLLWWGIEWLYERMADRAVQTYGGATVDEMALHTLWLQEEAAGIPPQARKGRRLSDKLLAESERITQQIDNWPGYSHQLEEPVTDLDQLLKLSAERIAYEAGLGHTIRVIVFDYLQLLDLTGIRNESEKISTMLGKIKLFCITHKLVGLIATQVTKLSTSGMKAEQTILEAESGQNFRSDKFNLVLTLNPVYKGKLLTDEGIIHVAKNSLGRTGTVTVNINPSRFLWIDQVVD